MRHHSGKDREILNTMKGETSMTYSKPSLSGNTCTAYIGTNTLAMKAQRALAAEAILSSVVKVNSSKTHKGCAYGIRFDRFQTNNVSIILAREGIAVKELL